MLALVSRVNYNQNSIVFPALSSVYQNKYYVIVCMYFTDSKKLATKQSIEINNFDIIIIIIILGTK